MKAGISTVVIAFFLLLVLMGCGGQKQLIKVVDKSNGKEGWVKSDKDYFEKDEKMHFRGVVTGMADLALAKREAKAEGVKNITEKVNVRVRTEFEQAVRGSNVDADALGRFVSDAVAWISDNLDIQGITPEKSYWEYIQETTSTGTKLYYNVWVLDLIPITDYERARNMAIRKLSDNYQKEQDKKAEEVAEEVKARLIAE